MKTWQERCIRLIGYPTILGVGYYLYSYNVKKQSPSSLFFYRMMRIFGFKKVWDVAEKYQAGIAPIMALRPIDLRRNPDNRVLRKSKKYFLKGMPVYVWNEKQDPNQQTILYLHGGGYIAEATPYHYVFINDIISRTNARIIFPIYFKAPKYSYSEVEPVIEELYIQLLNEVGKNNLVLMGDSAGGGLALSIALQLKEHQILQPRHILLISPWLDMELTNEVYLNYDKLDPFLNILAMQAIGHYWSGGTMALNDPRLSPIHGNFEGIAPIFITVGSNELLFPDSEQLVQKLEAINHPYEWMVGSKMNHIYPILPIFEARQARVKMAKIINKE